jgi:hypothetical protein
VRITAHHASKFHAWKGRIHARASKVRKLARVQAPIEWDRGETVIRREIVNNVAKVLVWRVRTKGSVPNAHQMAHVQAQRVPVQG